MNAVDRVSTARKRVAATTPRSTNRTSRRRFCVALIDAEPEPVPMGTKIGFGPPRVVRTRWPFARPRLLSLWLKSPTESERLCAPRARRIGGTSTATQRTPRTRMTAIVKANAPVVSPVQRM